MLNSLCTYYIETTEFKSLFNLHKNLILVSLISKDPGFKSRYFGATKADVLIDTVLLSRQTTASSVTLSFSVICTHS